MAADPPGRVDPLGNALQPGQAVRVIERLAMMHLLEIRFWVKPIAVLVDPMQPLRQHGRDRAFARAGHAHDD